MEELIVDDIPIFTKRFSKICVFGLLCCRRVSSFALASVCLQTGSHNHLGSRSVFETCKTNNRCMIHLSTYDMCCISSCLSGGVGGNVQI